MQCISIFDFLQSVNSSLWFVCNCFKYNLFTIMNIMHFCSKNIYYLSKNRENWKTSSFWCFRFPGFWQQFFFLYSSLSLSLSWQFGWRIIRSWGPVDIFDGVGLDHLPRGPRILKASNRAHPSIQKCIPSLLRFIGSIASLQVHHQLQHFLFLHLENANKLKILKQRESFGVGAPIDEWFLFWVFGWVAWMWLCFCCWCEYGAFDGVFVLYEKVMCWFNEV